MNIKRDEPLSEHSTMRLGGSAAHFATVNTPAELAEAVQWADNKHLPVIMIGDGSNIFWGDGGFSGLVLQNQIKGFESKNMGDHVILTVGAGENWDSVVGRSVAQSLHGIECLSLIPGTAGATPVQNVGAYGQEVADSLVSVQVYNRPKEIFEDIAAKDCDFGYRSSRFKTKDKARLFITGITLKLNRDTPKPPFYNSLQQYLEAHKITDFTPQTLRDAVIAIRRDKLPDPAKVANNGSFFHNPIIDESHFMAVKLQYPDIPNWPVTDKKIKISAAWLLEQAGFKDFHDSKTGMGTWPKQPLVLVNEHAKHSSDVLLFRKQITDKVEKMFGIALHQEPEFVGES